MIYLLPTRIWICLSSFYFAGFWSLSRHLSWSDQHPTSWKGGPTCIECWPVLWWIKNHLWHFYVAPGCRKWSTTGCHIFSYRSGVRPSRRYCLHSRIQERGKWYIFSIPHVEATSHAAQMHKGILLRLEGPIVGWGAMSWDDKLISIFTPFLHSY